MKLFLNSTYMAGVQRRRHRQTDDLRQQCAIKIKIQTRLALRGNVVARSKMPNTVK